MKKLFFGSESLIYEIDEKTLRKERIEKKIYVKKN